MDYSLHWRVYRHFCQNCRISCIFPLSFAKESCLWRHCISFILFWMFSRPKVVIQSHNYEFWRCFFFQCFHIMKLKFQLFASGIDRHMWEKVSLTGNDLWRLLFSELQPGLCFGQMSCHKLQNHSAWGWKGLLEVIWSSFPAQAGASTVICEGDLGSELTDTVWAMMVRKMRGSVKSLKRWEQFFSFYSERLENSEPKIESCLESRDCIWSKLKH